MIRYHCRPSICCLVEFDKYSIRMNTRRGAFKIISSNDNLLQHRYNIIIIWQKIKRRDILQSLRCPTPPLGLTESASFNGQRIIEDRWWSKTISAQAHNSINNMAMFIHQSNQKWVNQNSPKRMNIQSWDSNGSRSFLSNIEQFRTVVFLLKTIKKKEYMTQCQDEFRNLSGRVILILIKLRISNCCILLTVFKTVFVIVLGPFLPMLVIFFSGSPFQVKTNTFKKKSSLSGVDKAFHIKSSLS